MRKNTRKNNKRQKSNDKPVYSIIFEISKLFDSKCQICSKKMSRPRSGFAIHHIGYRKGEKTYADFNDRLEYHKYLVPIILDMHDKGMLFITFMFICNACHHSLDGPRGLNRRKPERVMKLFCAWMLGQIFKSNQDVK